MKVLRESKMFAEVYILFKYCFIYFSLKISHLTLIWSEDICIKATDFYI